MDPVLVQLAQSALAGIASRPAVCHGVAPVTAEERGREAAELARATYNALLEGETDPQPKAKAKR